MLSSVTDPLCSRLFFLDILESEDRNQYLDKLIEILQQYLDDIEKRHEEDRNADGQFAWLGSMGAVMTTRARLEWLRFVRKNTG